METISRKPFQGITNILRFNWHFYAIALILIAVLAVTLQFLNGDLKLAAFVLLLATFISVSFSLLASYYIYDCSQLYSLSWLDKLEIGAGKRLLNIHAGFDETSELLLHKYPGAALQVLDFYDPRKHTEVSIKRARKAYPAFPGTEAVNTQTVPIRSHAVDFIFLILSAHEIRNQEERMFFLNQLQKGLQQDGKMIVVEHLRDLNNFIAYNVGFLHFYSKKAWRSVFKQAGLHEEEEIKITPFISAFILTKHDSTS